MLDVGVLDKAIGRVPDWPKKGILFYDITGVLKDCKVFKMCVDAAVERYAAMKVNKVAALESRGFIFAAPIALSLGVPLVLIRKAGKLPQATYKEEYALEYGTASIEVHRKDIEKGDKFVVVDDLVATGGTLQAARKLIEHGGGTVAEFWSVIGLPALDYAAKLAPTPVTTLITYDGE